MSKEHLICPYMALFITMATGGPIVGTLAAVTWDDVNARMT
jgi:hypothetical protein